MCPEPPRQSQPVRDRTARLDVAVLGGEGSALAGRGDVGAVVGEDGVENIAGLGGVVAVGDHADGVLSRPLVIATYRLRQVVAFEASWRLVVTVSDRVPISVAA